MTPRIRSLEMADAADLARIHAAAFGEAAWNEAQIRDSLENPAVRGWAAETPEGIVGFLLFQLLGPEAEVLTLATAPAHRRQGIAEILMETGMKTLPPETDLHLEVAGDNQPAIQLYEKLLFEINGLRKGYYKRPTGRVDARLYRRDGKIK